MKRFEIRSFEWDDVPVGFDPLEPDDDGSYVLYEEAQAEIERLKAEIAAWEKAWHYIEYNIENSRVGWPCDSVECDLCAIREMINDQRPGAEVTE
jgi:hypothetical protein